jgi:DNA-binding MarR family transcriptional regulator
MMADSAGVARPPLLGALMRMPVEAVHRRILDDAAAAGFADLVPAHMAVLRYPGPDGRRPSELAAEAGISRQAMNYLLGQLEGLGYIIRVPDADAQDARSRRIELTERGRALRDTLRAAVTALEQELEAELGSSAYVQLRRLLVRLNDSTVLGRAPRAE